MAAATSLRETLTNAFAEAEAPEDAAPAPAETSPAAEAAETAAAPETLEQAENAAPAADGPAPAATDKPARNTDGTFAKGAKKAPAAEAKAKGSADPKAAPGTAPTAAAAPAPAPTEPALKAPSSWKPQAREKWGALPAEVQQEVARVDGEVRQVMQRAAGNQRVVEAVQRTLQPFEQMIRAEGHQPLQAVESLLRQAHLMRFGPPAAKMQFVEGLIERNQIPVDAPFLAKLIQRHRVPIEALADALEGKTSTGGQAQAGAPSFDPNALVQQVLSAVDQRDQERERHRAEQDFARMRDDGDAFLSKQEFGEDVRGLMADLLEMRARQGTPLSLEDAYNQAVQYHPEVSQTLKQRADAEAAKAKAASTQRARSAAVSVRSQPAGAAPAPKAKGLRGMLEKVWDERVEES